MKISVIMIDGQFRENTYGAEYFSKQDFSDNEYEIIWVEFYKKVPESVRAQKKVKVITLDHSDDTTYHSSWCFNKGIAEAKGELIVIPDADQIVAPDFLSSLYKLHAEYDKLVVYPYRYDEPKQGDLKSHDMAELQKKCILKNTLNYGGCLSVRKKWLFKINGYENHKIFESGFHANGLDIYTRFKNLGLAIMWAPELKLFHPWHANTLVNAEEYKIQNELVNWRFKNMEYLAIDGLSDSENCKTFDENEFMEYFSKKKNTAKPAPGLFKKLLGRI
ncbi:hypothetical protein BH09BAC5_BH09BAC5_27860 [soil metagenome]